MRELRLAESAGFCFGVRRSVEMAERLLAENGSCLSLGELIHNEDVVKAMCKKGMRIIRSPQEAQPGDRVLIRAHGAAENVYRELEERNASVTDATFRYQTMDMRIPF